MTTDAAAGSGQPGARIFSTGFGVLMVAVAAVQATGPAAVAAVLALAAMGAGLVVRAAATGAVLLTVVALAASDAPPLVAALSGLSATAYLLLRHAAGTGVTTTTRPTLIAMLGFTFAGVAATAVNVDLPWLPLLAPLAVVATYWLALTSHTEANGHAATAGTNTVVPPG